MYRPPLGHTLKHCVSSITEVRWTSELFNVLSEMASRSWSGVIAFVICGMR